MHKLPRHFLFNLAAIFIIGNILSTGLIFFSAPTINAATTTCYVVTGESPPAGCTNPVHACYVYPGQPTPQGCKYTKAVPSPSGDTCGGTDVGPDHQNESVKFAINIGCVGQGNPIADMAFALIRILSDGVGLVIIASIIWGGLQYATSQGNPQNSAKALGRIRSSIFALLLYIFGYAILNYIIPKGFLLR